MKIGVAQINPIVGDLDGNAEKIRGLAEEAFRLGCRLMVTPELALTGYPPEDLLLKPAFIQANKAALQKLVASLPPLTVLVGFVDEVKDHRYNAAAWIEKNSVQAVYHKQALPNYGVFDEMRYFSAGTKPLVRSVDGIRIGVTICEDIWVGPRGLKELKKKKPNLTVNLSASPFHAGKISLRQHAAQEAARFLKAPLLYANMVGGQDELVFDGGGFVCDAGGKTRVQFPFFEEGLCTFDLLRTGRIYRPEGDTRPIPVGLEQIHGALVTGLRDYVVKNNFKKVAIGLSGGIDSAVVAALATEAVGPQNVVGITMPSHHNSTATKNDAKILAHNLGVEFQTIAIQPMVDSMLASLAPFFKNMAPNITEENIQARVRGNLLMALSNKFGWLILTTGNKSEVSTGYCTLYGDTAGGLAVLKDVLKTTVYKLADLINRRAQREVVPLSTIKRPPTAELRENQKDEDTLGPYAELDPLIVGYVEDNLSVAALRQKTGADEAHIRKILKMIDQSEYKRRQAPPGIKITPRSFGRDHRMPITNRFRPA